MWTCYWIPLGYQLHSFYRNTDYLEVGGHGRQSKWKKVWPLTRMGQINQAQNANLKILWACVPTIKQSVRNYASLSAGSIEPRAVRTCCKQKPRGCVFPPKVPKSCENLPVTGRHNLPIFHASVYEATKLHGLALSPDYLHALVSKAPMQVDCQKHPIFFYKSMEHASNKWSNITLKSSILRAFWQAHHYSP